MDLMLSNCHDLSNNIQLELTSNNANETITSGAELEFLPLTDFPLNRLSKKVLEALEPIYQLSKLEGEMIYRQPHFGRFVQMLVTVGLINYYANKEHPGNLKYTAKLNKSDCEKIKISMLKTAQKYDLNPDLIVFKEKTTKYKNIFIRLINKLANNLIILKYNRIFSLNKNNKQFLSETEQPHQTLENTVLAIFDRLEMLNLIQSNEDNILNVGNDGSVHGTNKENINYYENLYNTNKDNRFRFRVYSGQEINFPVCDSIEEIISLYDFVVSTLKKNGVHFTTTSGVHLHVGIKREDATTEQTIAHLANVTAATSAASQIINDILPSIRQNNIYAMPFGDNVDEHIAHYQRQMSKLEYIQKKIDMMNQAVNSDSDLLADKNAAIYEFILGITYGIAPIQHEYNYKKILEISTKSTQEFSRRASMIVRNPRYSSINITPFLKDLSLPTYEWRVLPSCEDPKLQSKFLTFFYRIIESQKECAITRLSTDYQTNKDYISFYFADGAVRQMENTLQNWLEFTNCSELFTVHDLAKINDEAYWKHYDITNNQYINPEENNLWADGQYYIAPKIDVGLNPKLQDLIKCDGEAIQYMEQDSAILQFLNHALDINS
jgi:hypothetical protein